jgi:uncharacterized membrane protein YoaK (UPF0700 family)
MATTRATRPETTVRDLRLIGLTLSSGAIDAISFIALGKVFTAFMTGNVVFLGLGVGEAGGPDILRVLVALAAFAAGMYVATRIVRGSRDSGSWSPGVTFALAGTVVLQAGFLALWVTVSGRPGTGSALLLIGVMALAMGLQSGAVASLSVKGVFTTAATATLIFVMRDLAASRESSATERARLTGVLLALFVGAAAGGLLLVYARPYAPALPLLVTALVVAPAERRG